MHGGPKNRPPMKGQSRLLLEERGRPQTRDSILGLSQQVACGRDGQDLNKDKVPMCREEGKTPYYTHSTQQCWPLHENNRGRRKYDLGYDTPRAVDRGVPPGVMETREPWGRNEG